MDSHISAVHNQVFATIRCNTITWETDVSQKGLQLGFIFLIVHLIYDNHQLKLLAHVLEHFVSLRMRFMQPEMNRQSVAL